MPDGQNDTVWYYTEREARYLTDGAIRYGIVRYGRYDTIRYDKERCGTVLYGWNDSVRARYERYGTGAWTVPRDRRLRPSPPAGHPADWQVVVCRLAASPQPVHHRQITRAISADSAMKRTIKLFCTFPTTT